MSSGIDPQGDTYADLQGYFRAVLNCLKEPSDENDAAAQRARRAVSNVSHACTPEFLANLRAGDMAAWGRLLVDARKDAATTDFDQLKELSPYCGKALLDVWCGSGFKTIGSGFDELVYAVLKAQGITTAAGEQYLLIIPPWMLRRIRVARTDHKY